MAVTTKFVIARSEASFKKEASRLFLDTALTAIKERNRFVVSMAGGSTPKKVYTNLTEPYYKDRLPWNQSYVFWGDERCVPPDHADSNFRMTKENLLSRVRIPDTHIHRMAGETTPPRDAAKAYENDLRAFFKVTNSPPKFDLVLLGLGDDGHTASLFPGTTALTEGTRWVVANYVEKFSANRLTLTYPVLNNAHRVIFWVMGGSKATIVRDLFRTDLTPGRYPAQRVQPDGGELIWMFDSAAAAKLPASISEKATHI